MRHGLACFVLFHDIGYLHGIYIESGCSNVNGQNVCAGRGYPIAVAGSMVS